MNETIALSIEIETVVPARPKRYVCDSCKESVQAHRKHYCVAYPKRIPFSVAEFLRLGRFVRLN